MSAALTRRVVAGLLLIGSALAVYAATAADHGQAQSSRTWTASPNSRTWT